MSAQPMGRGVLNDFELVARREWLVTNGLGSFACGTIAGLNTRRYHGLLIASLRPPLQRTAMVAKLDVAALYRGARFELATNEYADGTIAPRGYVHLQSFRLEGTIPVWTWLAGDALLEQRVWVPQGENTSYVQYTLLRASESLQLELTPLCTYRDYHSQHRGYREMRVTALQGGVQIDAHFGARPYRIIAERGACAVAPDWYWNFKHRAETERGLDDVEDLFRPALFTMTLAPGESGALGMTAESAAPLASAESLARERERQADLIATGRNRTRYIRGPRPAGSEADRSGNPAAASLPRAPAEPKADLQEQLILAADQFIVERHAEDPLAAGKTIIAGYPWFGDWGRDTMIALPGLTLSTGRYEIAADILRTFAKFVSEGMLPNRFPDGLDAPEYNTVDATLWYCIAIDEYVRRSGERALLEELYPTLRSVIRWHQRGTRYGIKVDARDGLLHAGEAGVQLTWMDAKIGDWVVTPRTGKAVEINALWFNALSIMRDFARTIGDPDAAREYASAAEHAARSFNERFWYEAGGHLYDVIDTSAGDDASLRPNQLLAISLRHCLLDNGRARSVVDVCARELWTPVGLRSLAPKDHAYAGKYSGGPHQRDAVYHQGTVWSWLLGPFVLAHYRVHADAAAALAFLDGIAAHLRDACVGQISEIFDGDAPFKPRGCFAQAWGVAEILRAWSEIDESEATSKNRPERSEAVPALRR